MTTPLLKNAPMTTSVVQVFELSDPHAQELIVGLLNGVADMTVNATARGATPLISTTCVDDIQAAAVFRFVRSIDFNARLDYATNERRRTLVA
jgi:hypothetical protein